MKNKNLLVAALLATTSVQAKTWNDYRMENLEQENTHYSQIEATERVGRILKLLGQNGLAEKKFTDGLSAVELKAASIVEDRVRSSDFMKSVMQPAILALHEDRLRGAPMSFDPSDFESEVQSKIEDRRYSVCIKSVSEAGLDRVLKNFLSLVINLDSSERSTSGNIIEKDSSVSPESKAIASKIQNFLDQSNPALQSQLGHVFGVKVIDGIVRNIYFTQRADVTIQNPKTLPESEMSNVTLSMLSGFRSGEDYAFIASHDCLIRRINDETKKLQLEVEDMNTGRFAIIRRSWNDKEIQAARVRLNDLSRMKSYLEAKKLGAQTVGLRLQKMGNEIEKLLALFIRIQGTNIPVANEFNTMQVAMSAKSQATNESMTQTDRDFSYYQSMHRELDRLEEYLKQETGHKAVIQQSIERMKELK